MIEEIVIMERLFCTKYGLNEIRVAEVQCLLGPGSRENRVRGGRSSQSSGL